MGPFTIVKSIDNLTETLADMLSADGRGFTLSTKNIGNKNILKEDTDYLLEFSLEIKKGQSQWSSELMDTFLKGQKSDFKTRNFFNKTY